MMWPGTFENINDGTRDRLGLFGEWESRLNAQWLTLLGARYERVKTDAGNVRGYSTDTNGMGDGATSTPMPPPSTRKTASVPTTTGI